MYPGSLPSGLIQRGFQTTQPAGAFQTCAEQSLLSLIRGRGHCWHRCCAPDMRTVQGRHCVQSTRVCILRPPAKLSPNLVLRKHSLGQPALVTVAPHVLAVSTLWAGPDYWGTWICVPALLLTGCVTLDKSLCLSRPPFSHLSRVGVLWKQIVSLGLYLVWEEVWGWGRVFHFFGTPVPTPTEGSQELGPGEPHCLWPISLPL